MQKIWKPSTPIQKVLIFLLKKLFIWWHCPFNKRASRRLHFVYRTCGRFPNSVLRILHFWKGGGRDLHLLFHTTGCWPIGLIKRKRFPPILVAIPLHILLAANREYWMVYRGPGFLAVMLLAHPLIPSTVIGERYSQTISNFGHAALLRQCDFPYKRDCWTNSGGPLVNSLRRNFRYIQPAGGLTPLILLCRTVDSFPN